MSNEKETNRMNGRMVALFVGLAIVSLAMITLNGYAEVFDQPPPPCHTNPNADQDQATLTARGDIVNLPQPLKDRLIRMARRPHTYLPLQIYAEANGASQLFQYYLLDSTGFETNVFTAIFPGVNDQVQLTATGFDCGLPAVGAVRIALEPKPGLPTDPNDPGAFNDVFTDIHGLFVINNESGWYEGWMIHDLVVPPVAPPRSNKQAQFGMITQADADALKKMGTGNNIPGNIFTMDGRAVRFPSSTDHFPDTQTNVVPIQVSMGAYNCLQQSDCHAYWEFNYTGTNYVAPLYELPFTGGFSNKIGQPPDAFEKGQIGKLSSLIPGSGPKGKKNKPQDYGDNPNLSQTSISAGGPRDPDRFDGDVDAQREFRYRSIPSGLANEILLDVYVRVASFHASMKNLSDRLNKAYAEEVARVEGPNGDGVISAVEGDIDSASDGFTNNSRLFLPPTVFNRFAVTREINDGYLSPRFAPSQRAWVLSGVMVPVTPTIDASAGRDGDDR